MNGFKHLKQLIASFLIVALVFQMNIARIDAAGIDYTITIGTAHRLIFSNFSANANVSIYKGPKSENQLVQSLEVPKALEGTTPVKSDVLDTGVYYVYKINATNSRLLTIAIILEKFTLSGGENSISATNLVPGGVLTISRLTADGYVDESPVTVGAGGQVTVTDIPVGLYNGVQSVNQLRQNLEEIHPEIVMVSDGTEESVSRNEAIAGLAAPDVTPEYGQFVVTGYEEGGNVVYRGETWRKIQNLDEPVVSGVGTFEIRQNAQIYVHGTGEMSETPVLEKIISPTTTIEVTDLAAPVIAARQDDRVRVMEAVDGAVIKLYQNETLMGEGTYTAAGLVFKRLNYGYYTATQTVMQPISGTPVVSPVSESVYVRPNRVDAEGGVLKLYIENAVPNAKLYITKKNSEAAEPITGFADENGKLVIDPIEAGAYSVYQEVTIAETGTFTSLPMGYLARVRAIKEKVAPDVTISGGVEMLTVSGAQPSATIYVYKYGDEDVTYEGTADSTGILVIPDAEPGIYRAIQEYTLQYYEEEVTVPTYYSVLEEVTESDELVLEEEAAPEEAAPEDEEPVETVLFVESETEEVPADEAVTADEKPVIDPSKEVIKHFYGDIDSSDEAFVYPVAPLASSRVRSIGVSQAYPFAQLTLIQDSDNSIVATGTADSEGNFRFRNVPVGTYKVTQGVYVESGRDETSERSGRYMLESEIIVEEIVEDGAMVLLGSDYSNLANSFNPSVTPEVIEVIEEKAPEAVIDVPEDVVPLVIPKVIPAYIKGLPNNTFNYGANITRSEVAAAFGRIMNYPDGVASECLFKDVATNSWEAYFINQAYNLGLMNGYPNGTFKPTKAITRSELAVVFSNYLRIMNEKTSLIDNGFTDVSGHWAISAINNAYIVSILKGEGTLFKPNGKVTREEFVFMVNQLLKRPESDSDQPTFQDVDLNASFFEAIESAANIIK